MADTTFSSGTVIQSDWLNDVNNSVYRGLIPGTSNQRGTVVSSAGQTVFTVPFTYNTGSTRLDVYINGVHQIYNSSYTYTNSTTVTFTEGVFENAIVEFVE